MCKHAQLVRAIQANRLFQVAGSEPPRSRGQALQRTHDAPHVKPGEGRHHQQYDYTGERQPDLQLARRRECDVLRLLDDNAPGGQERDWRVGNDVTTDTSQLSVSSLDRRWVVDAIPGDMALNQVRQQRRVCLVHLLLDAILNTPGQYPAVTVHEVDLNGIAHRSDGQQVESLLTWIDRRTERTNHSTTPVAHRNGEIRECSTTILHQHLFDLHAVGGQRSGDRRIWDCECRALRPDRKSTRLN